MPLEAEVRPGGDPGRCARRRFPRSVSRRRTWSGGIAGQLKTVLPAALTSSFTVEAFIHADAFAGFYGDAIVGAVTDPSSATTQGWVFQVRLDGFGGTAVRTLAISLAQGGVFSFVPSTFVLSPGTDYYVAAAVDIPGGTVTFYHQNLTLGGPLQNSVAAHTRTALNNNSDLRIGALTSAFDFAFDGLIDEVRISTGVVDASQLLVAVPEPFMGGLLALGVIALGLRRRCS
jgi:hypothetical protein